MGKARTFSTAAETPPPHQPATAKAPGKVHGETFPADFGAALALQRRLNEENTGTAAEREARKPRLEALKQHIFKMQQGSPVVPISGDDDAAVYQERRTGLQRTKLELLAREHLAVKELLAAHDALAAELTALKKQKPD